jgi:hypothetical protein
MDRGKLKYPPLRRGGIKMEECAHRSSMPSFPAKVNRGITPERKKWSSSKLNLAFLWQCLAVKDYNPTPKSYYICRWLVSMFKLITQLVVNHVLESKTLFSEFQAFMPLYGFYRFLYKFMYLKNWFCCQNMP